MVWLCNEEKRYYYTCNSGDASACLGDLDDMGQYSRYRQRILLRNGMHRTVPTEGVDCQCGDKHIGLQPRQHRTAVFGKNTRFAEGKPDDDAAQHHQHRRQRR